MFHRGPHALLIEELEEKEQLIQEKEIHRGPPGTGFTLTSEANFDIQNKRLCNVEVAIDPTDAVN